MVWYGMVWYGMVWYGMVVEACGRWLTAEAARSGFGYRQCHEADMGVPTDRTTDPRRLSLCCPFPTPRHILNTVHRVRMNRECYQALVRAHLYNYIYGRT